MEFFASNEKTIFPTTLYFIAHRTLNFSSPERIILRKKNSVFCAITSLLRIKMFLSGRKNVKISPSGAAKKIGAV